MRKGRRLRSDLERIWTTALDAVDPEAAVRRFVRKRGHEIEVGGRRFDLRRFRNIWVFGAGKAVAPMGRSLERVLGRRITGGILVTKYGHAMPLERLELLEAGHPLPDANGVAAGTRLSQTARSQVGSGDLVFCLISGGGSALLVAPAPGIPWEDKQKCTQVLLNSGASIHEMNAVRKHLSNLKGGGLARRLASNTTVSLVLSDVVGDDMDTIASGPLVPDSTTFGQCIEILDRLDVADQIPASVRERFEKGAQGAIPETPKPGNRIFRNKFHTIVGSNAQACSAAARAAKRLGYRTMVLSSRIAGDTRESAHFHMSVVQEIFSEGRPLRTPACLISGGETTVRVTGQGRGGRNMEFVMSCIRQLAGLPAACAVASLGTDGTDGPTEAAGAWADNSTLERSLESGPSFLEECLKNNDSYEFFKRLGDLIITGPTRTNVMDLRILLMEQSRQSGKSR